MAAAAILDHFEWPMAISPQRLTIYLYSAHRAVIFAIAQLSCLYCILSCPIAVWQCPIKETLFWFGCVPSGLSVSGAVLLLLWHGQCHDKLLVAGVISCCEWIKPVET